MNQYHINEKQYSLEIIQARLAATDLVPSRVVLLENMGAQFKALENQGISNLAELRNELKNTKKLEGLASKTGILVEYLVLLRREIASWFPKPCNLKEFNWLPADEIEKLEIAGIHNSAELFVKISTPGGTEDVLKTTGIDPIVLNELTNLVDLTRVQWVSPVAAGMLVSAGYSGVETLAQSAGEDLFTDLARVNEGGKFFKGTIELRDCKRLIQAARYVSDHATF